MFMDFFKCMGACIQLLTRIPSSLGFFTNWICKKLKYLVQRVFSPKPKAKCNRWHPFENWLLAVAENQLGKWVLAIWTPLSHWLGRSCHLLFFKEHSCHLQHSIASRFMSLQSHCTTTSPSGVCREGRRGVLSRDGGTLQAWTSLHFGAFRVLFYPGRYFLVSLGPVTTP